VSYVFHLKASHGMQAHVTKEVLVFLSSSEEMSSFGFFLDGLVSGLACSPFSRLIVSRNFCFSAFNFSFSSLNSSMSWSRMRMTSANRSSAISSGRIFRVFNASSNLMVKWEVSKYSAMY